MQTVCHLDLDGWGQPLSVNEVHPASEIPLLLHLPIFFLLSADSITQQF